MHSLLLLLLNGGIQSNAQSPTVLGLPLLFRVSLVQDAFV
jgi:hypothetical protein